MAPRKPKVPWTAQVLEADRATVWLTVLAAVMGLGMFCLGRAVARRECDAASYVAAPADRLRMSVQGMRGPSTSTSTTVRSDLAAASPMTWCCVVTTSGVPQCGPPVAYRWGTP